MKFNLVTFCGPFTFFEKENGLYYGKENRFLSELCECLCVCIEKNYFISGRINVTVFYVTVPSVVHSLHLFS